MGKSFRALTVFSYWLAKGAPTGVALAGRGYPDVAQPPGGYDIEKGRQVCSAKCAICHAGDGQGQKVGDDHVFPPLWGKGPQDPRLVDASMQKSRDRFHAHDGADFYNKEVDGVMLEKSVR